MGRDNREVPFASTFTEALIADSLSSKEQHRSLCEQISESLIMVCERDHMSYFFDQSNAIDASSLHSSETETETHTYTRTMLAVLYLATFVCIAFPSVNAAASTCAGD